MIESEFRFQNINVFLDFCKSLLLSGDSAIASSNRNIDRLELKTVMKEFPRENDIDYFVCKVFQKEKE